MNTKNNTKMMFASKSTDSVKNSNNPWRILIVDDEPEVHNVTKMILGKDSFENRDFELISAFSGKEAREIMSKEDDIAVILLDVVMETGTAGLDTAEYIRTDLNNKIVRIILRTGQPGEAPDKRVVIDYDINDYKEKSELTSNKLFTSVAAALRSYAQFYAIERCKGKLKKIVTASAGYCKSQNIEEFSVMLLDRTDEFLDFGKNSIFLHEEKNSLEVLASRGNYASITNEKLYEFEHKDLIEKAFSSKNSNQDSKVGVFYFESEVLGRNAILVSVDKTTVKEDFELLEIFFYNTMSAFTNLLEGRKAKE